MSNAVIQQDELTGQVDIQESLQASIESNDILSGVVSTALLSAHIDIQENLQATVTSQCFLNGRLSKAMAYNPLPVVTEEDDGKVLKVLSGRWGVGVDETAEALSNLEIEELLNNFT